MKYLNIPNILTLLRIGLIPIFTLAFLQGAHDLALAFFILAGITDLLDGAIARAFKLKTRLGAFLDPAADKLLMNTSFVVFYVSGVVPLWLTAIVFARDLWIVTGLAILKAKGVKITVAPTALSKLNTLLQLTVLSLVFLVQALLHPEGWLYFPQGGGVMNQYLLWLYGITAGMTVITGIQYTKIGIQMLKAIHGAVPSKEAQTGHQ